MPEIKFKQIFFLLLVMALSVCDVLYADEYRVAVRAHNGIEQTRARWQPTLDYLQRMIPGDHAFRLLPVISLAEITRQACRGEYDFVLTNPLSFIEIEQACGAKALVTMNNRRGNTAQDRYGAVVFTHVRHQDILNLQDLKGKTVMAVSERAFGGWRMAWREFIENNIDPYGDFRQLLFANGVQENVVYAVRDGRADVGVVRTDQLENMEAAGKIDMRYFRIINLRESEDFPFFLSTRLYPEWPFAALKHIPAGRAQQITDALLAMPEDTQAARLGRYRGWVLPRNYQPVRDLMKQLQVGSYN